MATTAAQMVADAKAHIDNLTPAEVAEERASGNVVVIDVREPSELAEHGMVQGAVSAPRGMLEFWADHDSPYHRPEFDPTRRTILYCASGGRSALACATLHQLGYEDVAHLDGGVKAWKAAGLELVASAEA